jgi:hypothetical protein
MLIASYKNIKDWEKLPEGLLQIMSYASIAVGLNSITEKNKHLFALRLNLLQKVNGPWSVAKDDFDGFIKLEHVEKCVGLKTNVTNETKAQFLARTFKYWGL